MSETPLKTQLGEQMATLLRPLLVGRMITADMDGYDDETAAKLKSGARVIDVFVEEYLVVQVEIGEDWQPTVGWDEIGSIA